MTEETDQYQVQPLTQQGLQCVNTMETIVHNLQDATYSLTRALLYVLIPW